MDGEEVEPISVSRDTATALVATVPAAQTYSALASLALSTEDEEVEPSSASRNTATA